MYRSCYKNKVGHIPTLRIGNIQSESRTLYTLYIESRNTYTLVEHYTHIDRNNTHFEPLENFVLGVDFLLDLPRSFLGGSAGGLTGF